MKLARLSFLSALSFSVVGAASQTTSAPLAPAAAPSTAGKVAPVTPLTLKDDVKSFSLMGITVSIAPSPGDRPTEPIPETRTNAPQAGYEGYVAGPGESLILLRGHVIRVDAKGEIYVDGVSSKSCSRSL